MNKINLALETLVLLAHLIAGVFVGYINSINESQAVITSSFFLNALAMFILWGVARLKGKYLFFEIESVLHGTIVGAVLASTFTVLNIIEGDISATSISHWLIGISTGLIAGAIYGKFAEMRVKKKLSIKR